MSDVYQAYIKGMDEAEPDWRESFAPGTFGCHEALARTSFIMNLVDGHMSHPGILQREEWYQLASDAFEKLYDLYQAIGAVHLNQDDKSGQPANPT